MTFVPHLLPVSRGILETITVETVRPGGHPEHRGGALGWYAEDYCGMGVRRGARRVPPDLLTFRVPIGCRLSAAVDERAGKLILFSAEDNLLKGASGAAVQNMNLALGQEEDLGLEHLK